MKLGKSKKNTPGCLTNKAMSYIKSKPAMYGKPAKFEDQKGTSEGITKADVISARTKGYNPKMYGDPVKKTKIGEAYDKLKEEGNIRTQGRAPKMKNRLANGVKMNKSGKDLRDKLARKLGRNPTVAEYNRAVARNR